METTLSEVLRIILIVASIAGFAWTLLVMYRYYQVDDYPTRLVRMLRRLGIEITSLRGGHLDLYRPTAIRLCHYCSSKAECDAWLAQKGKAAAPPEFCPNARIPQLVTAIPWMRAD